jgi:hypothetical protein
MKMFVLLGFLRSFPVSTVYAGKRETKFKVLHNKRIFPPICAVPWVTLISPMDLLSESPHVVSCGIHGKHHLKPAANVT